MNLLRSGFLTAVVPSLLIGCTSFEPIDRGVCGNGLLEAGEDCDSDDPSCVRCAVTCTTSADCPTADYTCGVDGVCAAPSGALALPVATGPFQAAEFRITDVDHDGIGDVLGVSRTSIVVRHGDQTASLATTHSLITPSQTGPAAFGDLDNDASIDVTITTPDGLVPYTSAFGAMAPLAVRSQVVDPSGNPLDLRMLFRVAPLTLGGFIADDNGRIFLLVLDLLTPEAGVFESPCVARVGPLQSSDFSVASVDIYQASTESDLTSDLVVSMVTGSGDSAKLCVMAIHKPLIGAGTITDITPANAGKPSRKPVLAKLDTDADRCPDLINTDGGAAALRHWEGQMAGGHCSLTAVVNPNGTALPAIGDAAAGAQLIGRAPLEPAIALLASDALVTSDGMYGYSPGFSTFGILYKTTRRLARVAHGDLNGDGRIDCALGADGEDDLDLLYRSPSGFQLLRLDTASPVSSITIGDYDGNGSSDVAYTEQLTAFQRLMIAYGTPDQVLPPTMAGAVGSVVSLTRLAVPDSVDRLSLADDLVVLQPAAGAALPTMTMLHGSPQRTMLPYFDPRETAMREQTLFRGAVIGAFAPSGEATEFPDIIGLAPPGGNNPVTDGVHAWRVPGTSDGLDGTPNSGVTVEGFADCSNVDASGLCVHDVAYLAWPVAADRDVVIGVDRASPVHAMVMDPWSAAGGAVAATDLPAITAMAPADASVRSLHATDFEGDGALDLVALFAPNKGSMGQGALLVCSVTAGVAGACTDLVPAIVQVAPGITRCVDAAPARIAFRDATMEPGGGRDLVVACQGEGSTLFRIRHTDAGPAVEPLAHTTTHLTAIKVGDVTGDGVDDVVAIEGEAGAQAMLVYPQCSSRTAEACRLGTSTRTEEAP
ncbi:MAG: FG-GAP repeat domain-containing protein [Kofleriaceae bacterium]